MQVANKNGFKVPDDLGFVGLAVRNLPVGVTRKSARLSNFVKNKIQFAANRMVDHLATRQKKGHRCYSKKNNRAEVTCKKVATAEAINIMPFYKLLSKLVSAE